MNKGILYGLGAYAMWGILPIYWKILHAIPAGEILGHRMVWSLLFAAGLLTYRHHWRWLGQALRSRRILFTFVGAAAVLTLNWFTYIWAVNAGFIVETSLGYFINPLLNVLLGVLLFHERLRGWQWAAIGVAGAGVLYLTVSYGALPWIGLTLAGTFAIYGVLKKTTSLNAQESFFLEMAILFIPALTYLIYLEATGRGVFGHTDALTTGLLVLTGAATALPLLMFAASVRRIPLSLLGLLQYLAPTCQFLLGVLVYGEPFTHARMVGFSLIWTALIVYSVEGFVVRRRRAGTYQYAH